MVFEDVRVAGYLIANIDVKNTAIFDQYRSRVAPLIAQYGGRYLVRGGAVASVEGALPLKRLVILEFPSLEKARAFYDSADYAPLIALRKEGAECDIVLVEGYDG